MGIDLGAVEMPQKRPDMLLVAAVDSRRRDVEDPDQAEAFCTTGRVKEKVVPWPGALSTRMAPP